MLAIEDRKLKESFSVFHLLNGKVGLLLAKREGRGWSRFW